MIPSPKKGSSLKHTDRAYAEQLRELRDGLLNMAGRVEAMIELSIRSLVERDTVLAKKVIKDDLKVNRCELELDELCLLILAKRQPMASDLRLITLSMKTVTDLERIGDLAVNIAERAEDLSKLPPLKQWTDIPQMGQCVLGMLRQCLDAFVERDIEKAKAVMDLDDEIDDLYDKVFREILTLMSASPEKLEQGIHIQSVAKWLERMGDHATNVAEQVIFMLGGQDVRHPGSQRR